MKRKILIVAAVLVSGLIILAVGSSGDEPLDPAAEREIAFRYPETAPAENAHVGISGLGQIGYGDVVTAGLKYLKDGPERTDGQPQDSPFDFTYKNPCLKDDAEKCLARIAADARTIDEAIQKNSEIIERYGLILKMPRHVDSSAFMDPIPQYWLLLDVARLVEAKALLDITRAGPAAGLDSFEENLDFYARICGSEYVTMIELMVAVGAVKFSLTGISKIIEDDRIDLSGFEDRLRKMLELNIDARQMITAALIMERRQFLQGYERIFGDLSGEDWGLREKWYLLFYKKNMTINRLSARTDEDIRRIQAAPLLNFPDFYASHMAEFAEREKSNLSGLTFKELYDQYGIFFFKNYSGEIMIRIAQPDYMRYVARVNDTLVFSRLVRAQLELRLMDDRPDDITAALAGLGPETWNPYTGKPFEWNKEKNALQAVSAVKMTSAREADPSADVMEVAVPNRRP